MSFFDSAGTRRLGALHSLPEIFEGIEAAVDADEALALALDALAIALRTERVAIVLFDADGSRRSRSRGLSAASRAALEVHAFDVVGGVPSRLVPDLEHDAALGVHAADLIADGVRSVGIFALTRGGRSLGPPAAAFGRPRDFADSECAAAHAVAHSVCGSIERRVQGAPAKRTSSTDPETRFRMLLEAAPDPIVTTDDTGRIRWVNSQTERSFGWSRDELIGQPIEKLVPEGVHDAHSRHRAAEGGEPNAMGIEFEPRALRKDGVEVPVEISLSAMPSNEGLLVTAIVRDVSDRVQLEEERASLVRERIAQIEAEKSRHRSVFLAEATRVLTSSLDVDANLARLARLTVPLLADGCVVDLVSDDGSIRRVATAHVDAAKEPLLRHLLKHESLPAMTPGAVPSFDPVSAVGAPDGTALHAYLPDPEQVRLIRDIGSVMVMPLVARDRTLGMLTCFRVRTGAYDPEDLEFAQDLANRTATALENARLYDQALEANRLKDEFLATLSHELRTPLNAILGWAHLLGSGHLDLAKTGQAIDTIQRNAQVQSQLIGDILDSRGSPSGICGST
jgi:PAS domain S-box-containing protein